MWSFLSNLASSYTHFIPNLHHLNAILFHLSHQVMVWTSFLDMTNVISFNWNRNYILIIKSFRYKRNSNSPRIKLSWQLDDWSWFEKVYLTHSYTFFLHVSLFWRFLFEERFRCRRWVSYLRICLRGFFVFGSWWLYSLYKTGELGVSYMMCSWNLNDLKLERNSVRFCELISW